MSSAGLPFSTQQQEYLKGLMAGIEARRAIFGLPIGTGTAGAAADPTDLQRAAQDRTTAAGGKLVPEEEAKRKKHPLNRFDEVSALARAGQFPKGTDVFLGKFFGMFYVAPAQNAFMCRLRIPNGILTAAQFRGVADIADDFGGGYADITTRANLQIREIGAGAPPEVLMRLTEIGLTSRGSGADNVRNITGSPTAGIDPQELIDTRPHARALHHFILHHHELYGLPRKFNIAFDGGGRIAVLEDTNDIAFTAVTIEDGFGVPAGVYYRLGLGGITGHRDFARETGVIVAPGDTTRVANAILRVFIAEGVRTDRTKARLKYVLDRLGLPKFLDLVEVELNEPMRRIDSAAIRPSPPQDRLGHVGVHPQKQPGRFYVGVVCPVGRLTTERMRGLAAIAERFGSSALRLTVWQNLLI
jgi:ferredoxin-nitrite reductase